jgi:hypothetical protein
MSEPPLAEPPVAASQSAPSIVLSRGEFLWLTFAVWTGGIFILTLTPLLLIPRLGMRGGVIASYFVFFLVWQPIQSITQRTLGMRAAFIRMLLFVGGGAAIAFYLRELLLRMSRG